MTRRLLLVTALALAVVGVASPSWAAATHTVTLSATEQGTTVTIRLGDTVTFDNTDGVTHHVKSQSPNWSLDQRVAAGKQVVTPPFGAAGTFTYTDSYAFGPLTRTVSGSVVVPSQAAPSPTPSSRPSSAPSAQPSAPPPAAQPAPSAAPSASATPGAGVAVPPPISGGIIPTPGATAVPGLVPQVAPPGGATPAPAEASPAPAADVVYGDSRGIVQGSAHRFGLPAVLALVAALGVLTLLGRVLLRAPEAGRRVR